MRPTGRLHLGNYMGALYNWVQLQRPVRVLLLHRRLARPHHRLRRHHAASSRTSVEVALDFLAAGLDPERLHDLRPVPVHATRRTAPALRHDHSPGLAGARPHLQGPAGATQRKGSRTPTASSAIRCFRPPTSCSTGPFCPGRQDHRARRRRPGRRTSRLTREVAAASTVLSALRGDACSTSLPRAQGLLTPAPSFPAPMAARCPRATATRSCSAIPKPRFAPSSRPWSPILRASAAPIPAIPTSCPVGDLHKVFSEQRDARQSYEGCRTAGIGCIECKGWVADTLIARARSHPGAPPKIRGESRKLHGISLKPERRKRRRRCRSTMEQVREAMHYAQTSPKRRRKCPRSS